jgi:hypothetical protein
LHGKYGDQIDFYAIYIQEAHPTDGWRMQGNDKLGIQVATHKTFGERVRAASQCCDALNITVPLLIDSIDDKTNRAYSGLPDRLYLIDREGKVAYKGGRGPFGFLPGQLEQQLVMLMMSEPAENLEPPPPSLPIAAR